MNSFVGNIVKVSMIFLCIGCSSYQVPIEIVRKQQEKLHDLEIDSTKNSWTSIPEKNLAVATQALNRAFSYYSRFGMDKPNLIFTTGQLHSWATATPGRNIMLHRGTTFVDSNHYSKQSIFTEDRLVATLCHELAHIHADDWAREYRIRSRRFVLNDGWSANPKAIAVLIASTLTASELSYHIDSTSHAQKFVSRYIATFAADIVAEPYKENNESINDYEAIGFRPFWSQGYPLEVELQADLETIRCLEYLSVSGETYYSLLKDAYSIFHDEGKQVKLRIGSLRKLLDESN